MFTQLFKSLYKEGALDDDYFSRLDKTFFTLFQLMTLDSWSAITKQVMQVYSWAWIPFVSFVLISSFIVINLVIAVICDAVGETQKTEIDSKLMRMSSVLSDGSQNENEIKRLEKKIDDLTAMIQEMILKEHSR